MRQQGSAWLAGCWEHSCTCDCKGEGCGAFAVLRWAVLGCCQGECLHAALGRPLDCKITSVVFCPNPVYPAPAPPTTTEPHPALCCAAPCACRYNIIHTQDGWGAFVLADHAEPGSSGPTGKGTPGARVAPLVGHIGTR
jgi:hypothetical protein